jgi:hypothetical protein
MTETRRFRYRLWVPFGLAAVLLALIAWNAQIYRDLGYVDKNTGSRKGHREWFFGVTTGDWYRASNLELFMHEHYPREVQHQWVCYMGTGRNFLGKWLSSGHGIPGPIILLPEETLNSYIERITDPQKKALYDVFVVGDDAAVNTKIREIWSRVSKSKQD